MSDAIKDHFLQQASEWICDSYSIAVTYLATSQGKDSFVLDASLVAFPFPLNKPDSFSVKAGTLLAGQRFFQSLPKKMALKWIADATSGHLNLPDLKLRLQTGSSAEFYSNTPDKDTWFSDLHLQVSGSKLNPAAHSESIQNEHALRCAQPPFDGIADLGSLLQLSDQRVNGQAPRISIRVLPPVDMDFSKSSLSDDKFKFFLSAHSKFKVDLLSLGIRELPGDGTKSRKQVSDEIRWKTTRNGVREGYLEASFSNADSVLILMSVGGRTTRRQWFIDRDKAANSRYVATQLFDRDLKQLKSSVLEPLDSARFERGVASLLFLLGFSPSIQVETQAPDIVIATAGGKLAIVECTTRIADFQNKLGKLVDRRNELVKALEASGHHIRVDALLVCALPRAQVAVDESRLVHHHITLLCKEELNQAFNQVRRQNDPDAMLDQAAASLALQRDALR